MLSELYKKKLNIFTIKDIQRLLGVSDSTIYKLVHLEEFPKMQKIKNQYCIDRNEFAEWAKAEKKVLHYED